MENLLSKASDFFQILPQYVFPLITYVNETSKSFDLDLVVYKVLFAAANRAKTRKVYFDSMKPVDKVARNSSPTQKRTLNTDLNFMVPHAFACPISGELMKGELHFFMISRLSLDPVVAADGFTVS